MTASLGELSLDNLFGDLVSRTLPKIVLEKLSKFLGNSRIQFFKITSFTLKRSSIHFVQIPPEWRSLVKGDEGLICPNSKQLCYVMLSVDIS